MKSLSLREKILISLVAAAVLSALILMLMPAGSTGAATRLGRHASKLSDFSSRLALEVTRNGPSAFETTALEKAVRPWSNDPFASLKGQNQTMEGTPVKPGGAVDAAKLSYSGYLQMGARKLAIIDGLEYAAGEHLTDHPDLTLRQISYGRVVLVQADTGARIVVPIEED